MVGGQLQLVRGIEQPALLEVVANQLQAHGQAARAHACGHAHAGQAGQRRRQGVDVGQVAAHRVGLRAQLRRHVGRHRAKDYTDLVDMYKKTRAKALATRSSAAS